MSTGLRHDETTSGHSLVGFADALEALLEDASAGNAWTMTPAELQAVLPRLTRATARLTEVELRVLAEADRHAVGDDVGATDTPAWWAHVTGQRVPAARAAVAMAQRLDDDRHQATRQALAQGRVQPEQATVVLDAVAALPVELVPPELLADAESHRVGLADLDGETRLDPQALRIAGRKILEVVAPDVADAHEQAVLEAEERHGAATASFTMRPDGHGSMVGRFKIPVLAGEVLAKHLNAIAAPRHQRATGTDTGTGTGPETGAEIQTGSTNVTRPLRWGHAFT